DRTKTGSRACNSPPSIAITPFQAFFFLSATGTYFGAMSTPEDFLRTHGLEPLEWDEVLRRVETRLEDAEPGEAARFARLHRAFVAYPTPHTCRSFYDFIARHDLHALLACHRFHRLAALLRRLHADLPARKPGAQIGRAHV